MHVDFDPEFVNWDHLLIENQLPLTQFGGGSNYPVFRGLPYQRGGGIGSIFRTVLRFLIPLGKEAGAAIGRQGLESTSRVLSNVLEGKDVKQALKEEGRSGLKNLLNKAADRVGQMGSGRGKRRKHINKQKSSSTKKSMSKKRTNQTKKSTKIFTKFPPPILPNRNLLKSKVGNKRKLRFDALGPY